MAQQIIPATQLVPKFQGIGRCNNYVVLQSITCSPECKIMGQILLDHPLSYALTATADVPTIQEIIYTVDMFHDTLQLPVETRDNPFIAPVNIEIIDSFMNRVGYQGVVDKKKDVIQYPRFTKLIITNLMKKYPSISPRLEEDYHSIKDDIPLKEYETVFVNVVVPMNQPELKRKQSARETSSPRKSLKVTIRQKKQSTTLIPPPSDDRERDEIAKATLLSLALHKTAIAAKAQ
ncbi:hypothetical protein Tco_0169389 [Tanacetum coccineum]